MIDQELMIGELLLEISRLTVVSFYYEILLGKSRNRLLSGILIALSGVATCFIYLLFN
jgi:hypothetical protein